MCIPRSERKVCIGVNVYYLSEVTFVWAPFPCMAMDEDHGELGLVFKCRHLGLMPVL